MALPENDAIWPPEHLHPHFAQLAVWRAWWVGDPRDLTAVHTRMPMNRPSQYRGGAVGLLARTFWGKPTPTGEQQSKTHVPVAADVSSMSADLLFSEPPKLGFDDQATKDRVEEFVEAGLWTPIREAAESSSALGGTYLRVVWDKSVADSPWLGYVDADCAVPDFAFGKLRAVTFWHEISHTGDRVVRFLERHEPGKILLGLYEGNESSLGRKIPLTESPETAALAGSLDEGDTISTGTEKLTAQYVPNMGPNKVWRLPFGRSDYAGIEGPMGDLDEAYTSWMRDVRLAKSRLKIPEYMLSTMGRGQGATFDTDRELLMPVVSTPDSVHGNLELFQPTIRWEEHRETCGELVQVIVRGAGYSMATFSPSDDVGGAVTATEIKQREKRSLTTRGRKISYWTPALASVIEALLAVDEALFGGKAPAVKPTVEFPDAVSPDPTEVATTIQTLDSAAAMSATVKVQSLHPDWDEDQVEQEVARLIGSDVDRATTAMNNIAVLAANLGKAFAVGGVDEATAGAIMEYVLSKVVDEDGNPIESGATDFGGAAEHAEQVAREALAAKAPPGAAGKPGSAGKGSPGPGPAGKRPGAPGRPAGR
jgi:A118 family predicted phage portal protein